MYIPPLPLCVAEIGELKVNLEMFSHPSTYWPCKLWNLWSKLFCWRMFVNHHLHGRLTLPKTNSKSPFSKKPQSSNHFSAEGFTDLSGKIMDAQVPKREGIWDSSQQKKYFLSLSSANDSKINRWLGIPTICWRFFKKTFFLQKKVLVQTSSLGMTTFPGIQGKILQFPVRVPHLEAWTALLRWILAIAFNFRSVGGKGKPGKTWRSTCTKKNRGLGVCVCVVSCFPDLGWS